MAILILEVCPQCISIQHSGFHLTLYIPEHPLVVEDDGGPTGTSVEFRIGPSGDLEIYRSSDLAVIPDPKHQSMADPQYQALDKDAKRR